jgi:hypothetical protein
MMPCFFFTIESLARNPEDGLSTKGQANCSYGRQRADDESRRSPAV